MDANPATAAFCISVPLEKLLPGRYVVQAVAVEAGGDQAAFARAYFALRRTKPANFSSDATGTSAERPRR